MLMWLVAGGDLVDVESGDDGNIISELFEEDKIKDMCGNVADVDGVSVPVAVSVGDAETFKLSCWRWNTWNELSRASWNTTLYGMV